MTTKKTIEPILKVENAAHLLNPMSGGADAEAESLRQEILNTKDTLVVTGTTYYVSPSGDDKNNGTSPETAWKTIDGVSSNKELLQPGDAVLFERGYVYRRKAPLYVKNGVSYGAYGEGEKPAIYGSAENYALSSWQQGDQPNVWTLSLSTREAGIVVFDHGAGAGMPKFFGVDELVKNGDFYHDFANAVFYMYLDKGNPADVYESIEIGTRDSIMVTETDAVDVTVDNLTFKYAGLFAFYAAERSRNIRITNCEFGWVGGCRFMKTKVGLGNGISFWMDTADALVENCWIYQCYDAGITPQGVTGAVYKNLVFRKNLIEFCCYSIETFDRVSTSVWDGLIIEDNVMRFAGYGFLKAEERPDVSPAVAHMVGWNLNYDELPGKGVVIRNNIFDCSACNLVFWHGKTYTSGLDISGNSFYQTANKTGKAMHFAENGQQFATNQEEFETAVRSFDPAPKHIKWLH